MRGGTLPAPTPSTPPSLRARLKNAGVLFKQLPGTFHLFWRASPRGAVVLGVLTLVAAVLPAGIAWVGKLIVDTVVAAAKGDVAANSRVVGLVATEFALMVASAVVERGLTLTKDLLRAHLGNLLNERILQKALDLELKHFEDSDTYDKMQNARREANARPLSLVMQAFSIVRNVITLSTYAVLLVALSPWSVVVLLAASIPAFIAEARLAAEGFRLYSWRAPEGRKLNYLEWILTRDSTVKEVKLFGLGPLVLGRYRDLFQKFFAEDRALARKRMVWGLGLGLLSLAAFYGCYLFVASRAADGGISVGDMVLYLAVFRQGQAAFQGILTSVGSMYEDALFMSNLFAYLDIPTLENAPRVLPAVSPPRGRSNAIELRDVSFRYAGKDAWALRNVNLTLKPGQKLALVGENGAGKSTLVKLLLRMYEPTEGQILYGGVDTARMGADDLRGRFGAVFQDFVRYQFSVSENIGLGHVPALEDRPAIERAAEQGGASSVIATLPSQYDTMLGGWFEKGQELSSGQWQKLAVSRAFMRDDAEVLILDEPTASIDAEAEHALFERFQALAADRIAIVISHRFSTVRMADQIAVLHNGTVQELGSHDELMALDGRYAHLFRLQARGYRD
ncbi:ABC transporter ATP-binding protein [Corallococcus exiguus]|uniref:ABC transporter ATP-binding protein n=1 Tax=Corallococcus TaxID=83461 RepID=UPI000EC099F8|nr:MULTISPECIES: ABC transporter ATP-binding protein [Corallococcus]NNC00144.1 ABC transporter ATP-binding protein [Corallococcus exiguus]NNC08948.1 ABC transporter ATP-binding protein [Corallococcus exiguus]NPC53048.1 ABC transporter ATP-binding protein [Corallococcus exiguus]RKH81630.1 ABC transporter ATP-binding protein [Corallococcus sp. AB032C]